MLFFGVLAYKNMVLVVQLVEHRIVVPVVAGSSPVLHPIKQKEGVYMSVPVRGLGFFSCEDREEELDFASLYAENLANIKAEYKARNIIPTEKEKQSARIRSAVYAATDLGRSDSMGAFFLNSQDPEDGLFGNLMPDLDWF